MNLISLIKDFSSRILDTKGRLNQVTPFSKIIAAVIVISLPFVGAYVGYSWTQSQQSNESVNSLPINNELESFTSIIDVPESAVISNNVGASSSISTSVAWKERMNNGGTTCYDETGPKPFEIRTARVPMDLYSKTVYVNFEYVDCSMNEIRFFDDGGSITMEQTNNESGEVDYTPIIDYWEMDVNERPEDFLKKLVATLPTQVHREVCTVTSENAEDFDAENDLPGIFIPGELTYNVVPMAEGATKEKLFKDKEEWFAFLCAQHTGPTHINFYRQIDNILLHINVGHDVHKFNAASITITKD